MAQRFGAGTDWLGAGRLGEAWWAAIVRRHHPLTCEIDDLTARGWDKSRRLGRWKERKEVKIEKESKVRIGE